MYFVVEKKHNYTAEAVFAVRTSYEDAALEAHKFFLGYDFELRDGRPFDPGNDDGAEGGFACFTGVSVEPILEGWCVTRFTHADGDGPSLRIAEALR